MSESLANSPVKPYMNSKDFMQSIKNTPIAADAIGVWFLGQNGFILRASTGPIIAIDPYLTDFCASGYTGEKTKKSRHLPVFIEPEDLEAELIYLTHSHCDHADPFTLKRLTGKDQITVLAPWTAAKIAVECGFPEKSVRTVHPGEIIEYKDILIQITFALPTDATDLCHTGCHIRFPNGKTFYNTGDTAVSSLIAPSVPAPIDVMAVCINAGYNNLSYYQAAELVKQLEPHFAVPTHYDTMPHNFQPPELFVSAVERLAPETTPAILSYGKPLIF